MQNMNANFLLENNSKFRMTETLVGQFPKHIGSTGGLLNSAETEEKYAIVWKSSKEQAFELPTGGAAIMHEGDNLMYFARKEQCLAFCLLYTSPSPRDAHKSRMPSSA